jgi:hypothetical protein
VGASLPPVSESGQEEVFIVLAAYNGARFIREQIDSIRAQTWTQWRLLVRDDASTDGTVELLAELAGADSRITVLPSDGDRLGPWQNFGFLLRHACERGCRYALFADQDDVWLEDKVERSLSLLRQHERTHGSALPALVHSDLRVVDESLQPIHPSYREYQRVLYDRAEPLRTLLLHSASMGCTMAMNRSLLEFALPLPDNVPHDWWLAQCAAAAGNVVEIPAPLVLYRQHGANVVGGPGARAPLRQLLAQPVAWVPRLFAAFRDGLRQAATLSRRINERPGIVPPARAAAIHAYAGAFRTTNPFRRVALIRRSRVRPQRMVSHPIFYGLALVQPPLPRR